MAVTEERALVDAGLAVLRRSGASGLTVADVLAEAGLSTRAFYRHFASKDELVLAVFEGDNRRTVGALREAVDAATGPRAALEAWIDQTLALAFDPRRARRTLTLWREGVRVRRDFPAEFDAILAGVLAPLERVLAAGRADGTFPRAEPAADARSIHAVVWEMVERRLDGDTTLTLDRARAHALRFCLAALGAKR